MASAPKNQQAEIDALRAEVAELRAAAQRQPSTPDEWRGMRDLSNAIERGELSTFLWKRSWEPWHTWFAIVALSIMLMGWAFLFMSRPH